MVISKLPTIAFEEVLVLEPPARGEGGFISTGV